MSVDYLLKGRIGELASWRITTSENAVPRGFSRKRKLGEVEGELTLIRLRIDGFRGRHNQEDRRRKVVWRARSRLDAILSRADEEAAAQNLPIKVSCSSAEEESARPGYLARKMDEAVAQFAQVCMVEEGALPRPLKEPQRVGTKTWMGRAVPHLDDVMSAALEEAGTKRAAAVVKPHWPADAGHGVRALPLQDMPCVEAALGVGVAEGFEVGSPVDIQCAILRPGTGRLIMTGNVSPEVERSARLCLCFLRLHSVWLAERFGPFAGLTPGDATADLRVHLCMANISKTGTSFAAALIVALAAAHLGCGVVPHVAATGQVTLSGPLGGVVGVAQKIRAAHRWFTGSGGQGDKKVRVIVPAENVRGRTARSWRVQEERDIFDGHRALRIELERKILKTVQVVPARSVAELLALCLVVPGAPALDAAVAAFPAALPPTLALAHAAATDDGKGSGALPQAVECALLKPGTGGVTYYSTDAKCQPKEADAVDVVLHWLRTSWGAIAAEWGVDAAHDPTVLDYHLHIHLPGLKRDARVAIAAGVALLSLFLGVPVPRESELLFMGEVQLNGRLLREATPHLHADLLALAKANQRWEVHASTEAALELQRVLDKRSASLQGVRVVGSRDMMDVFRKVFLAEQQPPPE